ncbi:ATP-binding protein [Thermodesulfobacteriota bacterium]
MKPGKLYIKIFLSFLMILVVTEILIFGFFIATVGKAFSEKYEQYTVGKIRIVKQVIEDKIRFGPKGPLDQNIPLKKFIEQFGDFFSAKVWLSAQDGTPLVKSFPGKIPEGLDSIKKMHERDYGDLRIRFGHRKHTEYYGDLPIDVGTGRMGRLHVFFEKAGPPRPEGKFAVGLVVLGLIIAVLTIPVSRIITKRIKNLSESANIITEGNLSHRAAEKGKDEIGDLCRAFNRMAEKLEQMIDGGKELTANISHELRTPLARIRIAEQLLAEKLERQEHKGLERHLNDIREDIGELDRLIGRILDLSKLDIHDKPLNKEPIDLASLVEDLLERFQPALQQKRITLTSDPKPAPPLNGNLEAISTALSNVLDNAVNYTPEQGQLIVDITTQEDGVEMSITNTCEALSATDLTRIFDPFYRAEGSRSGGSGLGLAITRKIIEKHGGTIEAANTEQGLRIRMNLPKGKQ